MKDSKLSTLDSLKGAEKVALVLMCADIESTEIIMNMMSDEELKRVTYAMTELPKNSKETVEDLLINFSKEVASVNPIVKSIGNIESFLVNILGEPKVSELLNDIKGPAGKDTWDKLSNINEELLANYLKNEYPQTIAFILSKIHPIQSAKVLQLFPRELTFDIIKRILNLDSVQKELLNTIEETLKEEFINSFNNVQEHDSTEVIAEIFNHLDSSEENYFMGLLEADNNEIAEEIRKLMFTFDDIIKIDGPGVQLIIRSIDKQDMNLALKGASTGIRDLFLSNMSNRAAAILEEELNTMGPVKLKDVNVAQTRIVNIVKGLVESGEVMIDDGTDELVG